MAALGMAKRAVRAHQLGYLIGRALPGGRVWPVEQLVNEAVLDLRYKWGAPQMGGRYDTAKPGFQVRISFGATGV